MKISIVTPSYNRATYIENTIQSVVSQKGDFDLQYIIQDGGSDDDVLTILNEWKRKIDNKEVDIGCNSLDFHLAIEPDKNMYDAINKGFEKADGDVMAWLNSDDMYHPFALSTVAEVFSRFDPVDWITGIPNSYNDVGQRVGFDKEPEAYSREYIERGFYDVQFLDHGFNWIQQESTFWRKRLWNQSSGLDLAYKYAADFYLWREFARHTDLVRVNSFLGGFRVHDDQFTADPNRYRSELAIEGPPPKGLKQLKQLINLTPSARAKYLAFAEDAQERLEQNFGLKRSQLCGRVVEWSHAKNEWVLMWKLIL